VSDSASDTLIWNFKEIAHHSLDGFGGMGEGMSMQLAKDGRRILWLAHESAPKNYTAVDVTDPKNLKIVARADLPQSHMRSNSLETVGDVLAIDEALERLAAFDPEQVRIIELRFFAGLTVEETAHVVGRSPRTVKREWRLAKAWLYRELRP